MAEDTLSRANANYEAQLDSTVKELQKRVDEQEKALEKIRASVSDNQVQGSDNHSQLRRLRALKAAYESAASQEPYLPPRESPLPALLALRSTHQLIVESRESLVTVQKELAVKQEALEREQGYIDDAQAIFVAMGTRIEVLARQLEERMQKSQGRLGRDLMDEIKGKKKRYDDGLVGLVGAFNAFVEDHLAAMLAAEEMGGPVVGDLLEIDELTLEAGFNARGNSKRRKVDRGDDGGAERRQRRIDEIWGPEGATTGEDGTLDDKDVAAAEMRVLTENLMNSLVGAEHGEDAYVAIKRESAASRFLVRSKVAQLHPRDALRLRLVDFGRELDG